MLLFVASSRSLKPLSLKLLLVMDVGLISPGLVHTAWSHGKLRPTSRRCGDQQLSSGSWSQSNGGRTNGGLSPLVPTHPQAGHMAKRRVVPGLMMINGCRFRVWCVCLLLQYLLQSCSRGERGKVEDSGLWSGDLHGKRYHRIELFDPRGFPCNYSTMVKTALSQWQHAAGPNALGNPG